MISFWLLMEGLCYVIPQFEPQSFFQRVKFVSIALIPPLYVLTAYEYTRKKPPIPPLLLFVVPALSLLSLATNSFPFGFVANIQRVYLEGRPIFTFDPLLGYWVHTSYSYINILWVCFILMTYAIQSPRLYRRQSSFIFIGSIISFGINLTAIRLGSFYFDTTSISMLTTLAIFYWGIFHLPRSAIKPFARDLVIESIKDIVIILDAANQIIDANPAALEFIRQHGKRGAASRPAHSANLIGLKLNDLLDIDLEQHLARSMDDTGDDAVLSLQAPGQELFFRLYTSPVSDTDGARIGNLFMLHDVTQEQGYLNHLRRLNDELAISDRIINGALEGVLITDAAGNITRVNQSFEKISGYAQAELVGQNPRIFRSDYHDKIFFADMWSNLLSKGYWEGEIWNRKKDGQTYPSWMSITALLQPNGAVENYICISTDISKIKKTEDALKNLAHYDPLTGIPNRALFYERLDRALVRAKRNGKSVALLFMDMDGFKVINDTLGHAAGDALLIEVAHRITSRIRESDTASRLGGDEFTVILEDIRQAEDAKVAAEALMSLITRPYTVQQREISLGCSVGIALAPFDERTVEGLVRKAEAAMYDAKSAGRGRYSFSSEEIENRNHEILEMQIKLNKALANHEFKLFLQPQMALTHGEFSIIGAEALIRWETAEGEIFTPDRFIPLAESNGMIVPIGDWVFEEIFRIDRALKEHGIDIKLSINVSSKQFDAADFVAKVSAMAEANQAQNIHLEIEITESFLLQDFERATESLRRIKALGIQIALDDFGTGFSSLNYLTRLPIDYLKIDKSFIDDIDNPNCKNLTPSIIAMARTLEIKTIAEGVETQTQIDRLIHEGCDELQGYYFSRPVGLASFVKLYQQNRFGVAPSQTPPSH